MLRIKRTIPRLLLVFLLAGLFSACSTPKRISRLEEHAASLLDQAQAQEFGVDEYEELLLDDYENYPVPEQPEQIELLHLDLRDSLAMAAKYSREYQSAKETLYLSSLSLLAEANQWDWNPVNNFSALWGIEQKPSSSTLGTNTGLGMRKRFFSGARFSANLGLQTLRFLSGDRTVNLTSIANVSLSMPLLAGRGADIVREPLTQAERNLIYALRHYVRAREALLINVAERYYAVLNAKESLEIGKATYASVASSLERSKAMADAGRVDPFQVDQAQQKVLTAESNLVSLEENYQSAIDQLKSVLGIPLDIGLEADSKDLQRLAEQKLPNPPMDFDAAVQTALKQRLDYATAQERLEDARRQVRIAEDALRPTLNLALSGDARSDTSNSLQLMKFADSDYTAGLDMELPLERTDELVRYRRSLIIERQQEREMVKARDNIIGDLRNVWRQLRSYEQSYQIQRVSVTLSEKRVESTQLLFEGGRVDIRELLDAQDDLSSAKNSLTRSLVNHRISWLKLLYQLGQLPIDPGSLWSEQLELQ
ncbi:MAG: TolC family protein [Oligosphaeraceae bacterium]|nr:TolC family protein [Oligosphaeraceae bacterium]